MLQRRLKRLQQHFSAQLAMELRASENTAHPESNVAPTEKGLSFVKATLRRLTLRQRSSTVGLYRTLLYWGHWLLRTLGAAFICSLFNFSRPLLNWILGVSILGRIPGQPLSGFPC